MPCPAALALLAFAAPAPPAVFALLALLLTTRPVFALLVALALVPVLVLVADEQPAASAASAIRVASFFMFVFAPVKTVGLCRIV